MGVTEDLADALAKDVLDAVDALGDPTLIDDIARIRELRESFGPQRFAVVGISLDTDRETLAAYLKGSSIPWVQLHEEGGLDGRLAEELGVLTLPTMLLLDAKGNVVDRNVIITDLEKKLGDLLGQP